MSAEIAEIPAAAERLTVDPAWEIELIWALRARVQGRRLEPPPEGTVPAAVLDAGRLRVLPQRHGTDGAFAARLRRVEQ